VIGKAKDADSCLRLFFTILVFAEAAATATAATTAAAIAATPASTTTAVPAATTTAAKASATTAAGFGPGFIHVQSARSQLVSVHRANGFFCFLVVCHLHKAKASWLAGIAVFQNSHVFDLPVSCKSLPEFIFTDVKIQIAYINILHAILLYWSAGALLRAIMSLVDMD
jgi:hypothetical protein